MPRVDVVVESPIVDSFRVKQAAGMFDVALADKSRESFSVEVPGADEDWQIGVIVGPSGSGKSTVAREAFGDSLIDRYDWPRDKAVIDGFDADLNAKTITAMMTAVGFSSPPAWVRPYHVLSGGQRMRCDLARALLTDTPLIAFDEFTSVVDRQVAKVASACVAKTIRKDRAKARRFVAVTCHYDIIEWLQPDWVLDMTAGQLARGSVRPRPALNVEVRRCHRSIWPAFARHHYLSGSLAPTAKCYAATVDGEVAGFIATMQAMGFKGMRRVTRLVTLPDYQGIGVGGRMLDAIGEHESKTHRMRIRTSHPGLIHALKANPKWRLANISKGVATHHRGMSKIEGRTIIGSSGRVTCSFEYRRGRTPKG